MVFPEAYPPRIVTFNSGYNYGVVPTDSVLGIGVEWFIGADHPVIRIPRSGAVPPVREGPHAPDLLVPSAVKGWLLVHYTRDVRGTTSFPNWWRPARSWSLLDALLPELTNDLKLTFTRSRWTGADRTKRTCGSRWSNRKCCSVR